MKCNVSIKRFKFLGKLSPEQQRKVIVYVLGKALPAAKHDLSIDELRPMLYQNGVITSEEATELLGIHSGEEKIKRLYTEMLPKKGAEGLKKFMGILHDTGWDTPSHLKHVSFLSRTLSVSIYGLVFSLLQFIFINIFITRIFITLLHTIPLYTVRIMIHTHDCM